MPRVLFDATPFSRNQPTGAGRYVRNLLYEFARMDHEFSFEVFGFEKYPPVENLPEGDFKYLPLNKSRWLGPLAREYTRRRFVSKKCAKVSIDILQTNLDPVPPPGQGVVNVCMLYDVMKAGGDYPDAGVIGFRDKIRTGTRYSLAAKADHLLTISDYSKKTIVELLKIKEEKITTTHLAAESKYKPGPADTGVLGGLGINDSYILFVGQFGRQKNEGALVEAYLSARTGGDISNDVSLVMVGDKDDLPRDLKGKIGPGTGDKGIIITGTVAEKSLLTLYRGALCFVLPSLSEGFGLPALEAMSCGTPVIISDVSSLPEIVESAGLIVSPKDIPALSGAMVRMCGDKALRDDLSRKGLARAAEFSFEKTAQKTLALYRKLLS